MRYVERETELWLGLALQCGTGYKAFQWRLLCSSLRDAP